MSYPLEKYRFYFANNKVIAVSTYAGKNVKGVAKCDGRDEFDIEKGKRLAAARCNARIAEKRVKRAKMKWDEAMAARVAAIEHSNDMYHYYMTSLVKSEEAEKELNALLADM